MIKISKILENFIFYLKEQEEISDEESVVNEEEESSPEEIAEDPKVEETPEEKINNLGRVFRLKKIYSRLISLSKILDNFSDVIYEDLKKKIIESIDIFHLIISNFDQFKDQIDDIINKYYNFLKNAVSELETLSKKEKQENE